MMQIDRLDRDYLRKITERIPPAVKSELITAYKQEWQRAYVAESRIEKQDNAGRFAANTLIRKLVRQYMETGSTGIPRICGNCDKCQEWNGQYYCNQFKQEIPAQYVNQENDCEQYSNEVPF